ncbi:MAG: hypothetical protein CML96_03945 [Rhodobiaceae bacterium]|nr:hypothetical protein [Rhodobiaceae bacterium]
MTEFAFYKTSNFRVDETLYVLVQKALEKNLNSVVIFETKEALKDISIMLWSKKPESFLPHSIERDNLSNDSPIYLTTREENPNKSQIIFSPEGALVKKSKNWKRCIYIFDHDDNSSFDRLKEYYFLLENSKEKIELYEQKKGNWIKNNFMR